MIKLATLQDRPHFIHLWQAFLTDQRKQGSHVHDSLHNVYLELGIWESYVTGQTSGGCLFWYPKDEGPPEGLVIWGEDATPAVRETDLGRVCFLHGVYVSEEYRKQGVTKRLFAEALKEGLSQGFDSVETFVLTVNEAGTQSALGFGTEPYMQYHIRKCRP